MIHLRDNQFFEDIISEMIDPLSKSLVLPILYCVYKNRMLKNVTIIWDYNNKQFFNSFVKAISYITYLNSYAETLPLAPSIESCHKNVYKSETVWATN